MDNKTKFLILCNNIKRDGIGGLLAYLEQSDFYTAPASTRFHNAYPGGLLEHSLNVYDEFLRLIRAYPEVQCTEESAIIVSLFHDICKVNMYVPEKRNRKNQNGQWEQYDSYSINEKFCFGGHGSKSVFIIQQFMKLTPEEATAINAHMGCWDGNTYVGKTYEQYPFAWLLHVADESATYIREVPHKKDTRKYLI